MRRRGIVESHAHAIARNYSEIDTSRINRWYVRAIIFIFACLRGVIISARDKGQRFSRFFLRLSGEIGARRIAGVWLRHAEDEDGIAFANDGDCFARKREKAGRKGKRKGGRRGRGSSISPRFLFCAAREGDRFPVSTTYRSFSIRHKRLQIKTRRRLRKKIENARLFRRASAAPLTRIPARSFYVLYFLKFEDLSI